MAVSFERYGRLYYLDPGEPTIHVGDRVLVPTDAGPEVAECVWAPEWVEEDVGWSTAASAPASPDDAAAGTGRSTTVGGGPRPSWSRQAADQEARPADEGGRQSTTSTRPAFDEMVVIYFTAPHRVDFRSLVGELARSLRRPDRPAPGRLPGRGPAVTAGIGQLRPRPVLRHVPQGLRAGQSADGQGSRTCRPTRCGSRAPAAG